MILMGISTCFLAMSCLVVGLEVFLNVVPPFDRFITYGDARVTARALAKDYVYKGNAIGTISEFKVQVKNNSLGFHDKEYDYRKNRGVYRILVFGDSQVEAIQVSVEKTFHKLLEDKFRHQGRNIEVIALGKSGYGPREAAELYQHVGKKYDSDLIIWSFTDANDIQDSHPKLSLLIRERNLRRIKTIPPILESSKIATFLYTRTWRTAEASEGSGAENIFTGEFSALNKIQNWDSLVWLDKWPPIFDEASLLFKQYYFDLIDRAKNNNKEIIVISTAGIYPRYLKERYKEFDWNFDKPDQYVKQLSAMKAVSFISMKAFFKDYRKATKRDVVYRYDGHLNQGGHRLVADALYEEVLKCLL